MKNLRNGYVVSDLHMFTARTDVNTHMERIFRHADKADFMVFNGDIFDFRWTTLEDFDCTMKEAALWLGNVCNRFPNCRFFYVMGNHDGLEHFRATLDGLEQKLPNFQWHDSHVKIGDCLFLHGDLPMRMGMSDPLERELQTDETMRSSSRHLGYRALISSRLHVLSSRLQSPVYAAWRIHKSLVHHHPELTAGLKNVYFGHIHKAFHNFYFRGLWFHNSGSAIKHLECDPLNAHPKHE